MSNTTPPEPPAQGMSSESGHTLPSRLLQPNSDSSISKRVCFYKSGDYKFCGHRMVINARTFKTFDALLDALSKKVPLPFGVRTISTPRGTHFVKGLEDLYDGGSYVCSDQKRVKPLNLDEVNRRQVPWNTTRLFSTGRLQRPGPQLRQFGRRNEATKRTAKVNERAAVRTPKRLTVIKNKDTTVKHTIVLQRRTAPTFDALLDYLSQILQFRVLKLYTINGRRVDGLAALILCSGVIVAAGNEPFRLGNYSFHQTSQMFMEPVESSMPRPPAYNNKSLSSEKGTKHFSQSSEHYIVNQINASRNGSTNNDLHHNNDLFETEINQRQMSLERCGTAQADNDHCPCIVPQDNDIEKSFCVNQDGSMTVEMKVRLTIKEEEMLHWTTTLSRTSTCKRTVCPLVSELGNSSPDSNNALAKNLSSISEDEAKEENHPGVTERGAGFNNEQLCQDYTSTPIGKTKPSFKRPPTPGPRGVKKSSVDSVKMVTESAVQESTMGHYSYMARMADGGTAEGYCVVQHSSSSKHPIQRSQNTASAGTNNKGSTLSMKSTGVAEVLQIENKDVGVRETVMHIYESQGCHDNYFANEQYSVDSVPLHDYSPVPGSRPSTVCGSHLSSNDGDIDSTWQPPFGDSLQRQKEEIFSLSSEPMLPAHKITNYLSSVTMNETQDEATSRIQSQHKEKVKDKPVGEKKKMIKPAKKQNSSSLTSSSEKKQKETIINSLKNSKIYTSDKISSKASGGKKTSSESSKRGQKTKAVEKSQIKKFSSNDKTSSKEKALLANIEHVKRAPSKNIRKAALKENSHNLNIPETKTRRSPMKNISDFVLPKRSLLAGKKTVSVPKSMTKNSAPSPKKSLELHESVSMPLLNPSPSEIHQYVESWLEKVNSDAVPYTEETVIYTPENQKKVVFQIGEESDSEEKSEKQNNPEECCPSSDDSMKKSGSCLSAPLCHEEQIASGSCVSMPTFRVEPEHQETPLKPHKSAVANGPAGEESLSSTHNILNSKAKMKPILEKICSSMECIRKVSDANLEKSNTHSDFSTKVASVFGSSCKAFLSYLSVMTLRDSLTDESGHGYSEAMLVLESLQKISVIENEDEQKTSVTDLHNKVSSQFRESWKDFQILRERVESKISETEFAPEVTSEEGDVFDENQSDIDELMDELNIPQDLREEITSTIQQVKSFYLIENTLAKPAKQSPELDSTSKGENRNEIMNESEQKPEIVKQVTVFDIKEIKQRDMSLTDKENEIEGKEKEIQVDDGDRENDDTEKIDDVAQERGKTEQESDQKTDEEVNKEENWDTEQDEAGSGNEEEEESIEKVEEGTEEEMAMEESEDNLEGEMDVNKEIDQRVTDEEDEEGHEDNIIDAIDQDEEEAEMISKESMEEEDVTEEDEGEHKDKVEDEDGEDVEVKCTKEGMITDQEEEGDKQTEEEEESDEDGESGKEMETAAMSVEEESVVEDEQGDNHLKAGQTLDEEEDDEEEEAGSSELNEGCNDVNSLAGGQISKNLLLEEALYLPQQRGSCGEDQPHSDSNKADLHADSLIKYSSEGQSAEEKDNGTDSANELETDERGEDNEERSGSLPHPVEVSQELLDFVNSALKSSSLIFTYDSQGNVRIEPDHTTTVQTKHSAIQKRTKDTSYGFKCLPSPSTSELSDYRPESSGSGGYKTQDSLDIVTESGEEDLERPFPVCRHSVQNNNIPNRKTNVERASSKLSNASQSKSAKSFSTGGSGTKASREDLSYFSAASSLKADSEPATEVAKCMSFPSEKHSPDDGVLIDQGRWLLKENHLIRKSPPVSLGMYGQIENTSNDSASEDSPSHSKAQHSPLVAISSSDLEEMAKPQTPKCTYFNMPHGSDSDPFMDDASVLSGKNCASSFKGRGVKVSPTIDTSKTWANKNGSMSSFASVEFKIPDRKVHPEAESSTVTQARRTPSARGGALQAQDSLETLHVRCGQYCPIL